MNSFRIAILLLLWSSMGKSQDTLVVDSCGADSLFYKNFVEQLIEIRGRRATVCDSIGRKIIVGFEGEYLDKISESTYCSLKYNIVVFNSLIERGLDLEFDYLKNPPPINYFSDFGKNLIVTHKLFHQFLYFNENYKKVILDIYYPRKKSLEFQMVIDTLIQGKDSFPKPFLLKEILLGKYDSMTEVAFQRMHNYYFHSRK